MERANEWDFDSGSFVQIHSLFCSFSLSLTIEMFVGITDWETPHQAADSYEMSIAGVTEESNGILSMYLWDEMLLFSII